MTGERGGTVLYLEYEWSWYARYTSEVSGGHPDSIPSGIFQFGDLSIFCILCNFSQTW